MINSLRAFRTMKGGALGPGLVDALNRLSEDPDLVERILDGEHDDEGGKGGEE